MEYTSNGNIYSIFKDVYLEQFPIIILISVLMDQPEITSFSEIGDYPKGI